MSGDSAPVEPVRVREGATFEVTLPEPGATGHRWSLADAGEQVVLLGERFEPPEPGAPLGAAGRRILTLRATRAGRHRMRFELARPWESAPASTHEVEAIVDRGAG